MVDHLLPLILLSSKVTQTKSEDFKEVDEYENHDQNKKIKKINYTKLFINLN